MHSLGSLGKLDEPGDPSSDEPGVLTPLLLERYGDRPEWMKIDGYRTEWDPTQHRRRSELMLTLRGKKYWFPLSPAVYETFVSKIVSGTRGSGLKYLQEYIRRYRNYHGIWPSQRYVRRNQLASKSFLA